MKLKNVEKILHKPIITLDGNLWFAKDVIVAMDVDTGITYEFKLVTQMPVKSSPNQQYYHMTRTVEHTATLRLHKMVDRYGKQGDSVYQLFCGNMTYHGYCVDIDTLDKFISVLAKQLPKY